MKCSCFLFHSEVKIFDRFIILRWGTVVLWGSCLCNFMQRMKLVHCWWYSCVRYKAFGPLACFSDLFHKYAVMFSDQLRKLRVLRWTIVTPWVSCLYFNYLASQSCCTIGSQGDMHPHFCYQLRLIRSVFESIKTSRVFILWIVGLLHRPYRIHHVLIILASNFNLLQYCILLRMADEVSILENRII